MFKRIVYENWTDGIPELSFWLTFSVFIAIAVRAFLMKKGDVQHISNLPLEEDEHSHSEDTH